MCTPMAVPLFVAWANLNMETNRGRGCVEVQGISDSACGHIVKLEQRPVVSASD